MTGREILRCEDLVIGYDGPIARKINLRLREGQVLLIKGDNGAGKSTLVKTLFGDLPPLGGTFQWGLDPRFLSLLPQTTNTRSLFSYTVGELLDIYDVVEEYRAFFSDWFKKKKLGEMSRGEKQKVFILTRFNRNTKVLILDEPFNHISRDGISAIKQLLEWILQRDPRLAIILVTHREVIQDDFEVEEYCL